jgi:hypothetical protein
MKKKHLHGKLSLKVKDLSALDGTAQRNLKGGDTDVQASCPECYSMAYCTDVFQTACCATNYKTCTQVGDTVNNCAACAPTYEYDTCPPNPTACGGATCHHESGCDGMTTGPTLPCMGC